MVCAGDVLILPPMWYHQVVTLSDSISVNTWSTAPDYERMLAIYEVGLPFETTWPRAKILAAATEFLDVLLVAAVGETALEAADAIIESRWRPLYVTGRLKLDAILVGGVNFRRRVS